MNKVLYQIDKGYCYNGDQTHPPYSMSYHPTLAEKGIHNYLVFDSFDEAMFHLEYIALEDSEYKCINFLLDGACFESALNEFGPFTPTKIPRFPPHYANKEGVVVPVIDPYFKFIDNRPLAYIDFEKELRTEVER